MVNMLGADPLLISTIVKDLEGDSCPKIKKSKADEVHDRNRLDRKKNLSRKERRKEIEKKETKKPVSRENQREAPIRRWMVLDEINECLECRYTRFNFTQILLINDDLRTALFHGEWQDFTVYPNLVDTAITFGECLLTQILELLRGDNINQNRSETLIQTLSSMITPLLKIMCATPWSPLACAATNLLCRILKYDEIWSQIEKRQSNEVSFGLLICGLSSNLSGVLPFIRKQIAPV
jgi:hypothetical protein